MSDRLSSPSGPAGVLDAQRLPGILSRYREPIVAWSVAEIVITAVPLAALWAGMWALMHVSYWLALALAVPDEVPEKDAIIIAAFAVVAFSLFVQGLTMPWLIGVLDLKAKRPGDDAP